MSLRTRFVVTVLTLLALGLLAAAVGTFGATRHYLIVRTDDQLRSAVSRIEGRLGSADNPRLPEHDSRVWRDLADSGGPSLLALLQPSGPVYASAGPADAPDLSVGLPKPAPEPGSQVFVTVDSRGGDWRLCVTRLAGGESVVAGLRTAPIDALLKQLALIESIVSLVVLAVVALLGFRLVRRGLRPLAAMVETAHAIGHGDLTRRVDPPPSGAEVSRLGEALNGMLDQIEASFRRQEESEARVRRFLADAAHELRTPVTTIRGYAELFRNGAGTPPDDLARSMTRIESEASRMGVLIDEMFLLARLDLGRPLSHEPVDLLYLATEAVSAARVRDTGHSWSLDGEPAIIHGDPVRLREALDNLLGNVRLHTPPGTAATVRVSRRSAESTVVLTVEDRGPGLPPGDPEQVFERFFRGATTRRPGETGAGLGLAIVAAVVAAHGGSVSAAPGAAGGARFEIVLPLARELPPDDDPDETDEDWTKAVATDDAGDAPGCPPGPGHRGLRQPGMGSD